MNHFIFIFIGSLSICPCFSIDRTTRSGPEWDSFKITWGPNPLSEKYFVSQPLTIDDAKKQAFVQISTQCEGVFLGQRFIKDNDIALVLIYDTSGNIAGVQLALPVSIAKTQFYKFDAQTIFNRALIMDIDSYVLTAYFVDPKTICRSDQVINRSKSKISGSGLWLQNGRDPIHDSIQMPLYENTVNATKWVKGSCFPSMGVHYWYDNRPDKDCKELFPVFLMYNKGKLTGFGWGLAGKYEYTKHTEPVPYSAVSTFMRVLPACLKKFFDDIGGFTAMHLYFNTEPWNLLC